MDITTEKSRKKCRKFRLCFYYDMVVDEFKHVSEVAYTVTSEARVRTNSERLG